MNDPAPQPALPPQPQPWSASWIFFGSEGLRAGWGILLFLALQQTLATLFRLLPLHRALMPPAGAGHLIPPATVCLGDGYLFLATLLVTFVLSLLERRRLAAYGLGAFAPRAGQFFAGLFWGVTTLSLLVAILWKLHLLDFNARILAGPDVARYAVLWLLGFLLVGFAEEYLLRGYLQFTLTRGLAALFRAVPSAFSVDLKPATSAALGFWTSAAILSFAFGAGHSNNPGESPLGLLAAGLAGLIFCLALWRTGSLWWAVGFHCTWDWAQSFLFGVGDSGGFVEGRLFDTSPVGKPILSGGATGPEGSLFVFPVLALVIVIILFTLPRQRPPLPPEESPAA